MRHHTAPVWLWLLLLGAMPACSSESDGAPSIPEPPEDDAAVEAAAQEPGPEASPDAAPDLGAGDAEAEALPDVSFDDASSDGAVDSADEEDVPGDAQEEGDAAPSATIPATVGQAQISFTVAASGAGPKRLEALDIANDTGTLTLVGAAHRGLAYQMHDWGQAGYVLYDVLSIAEDGSDLAVTYLYCQGTNLPYAYTESLVHPMDWESTSGTCEGSEVPLSASVELPALTAKPQPMDTGISIQGTDLQLGPAGGSVVLGGKPWQLVPFNTVDCSTNCPGGSWYEIHTLLTADQQGCFAILYLFPDSPSYVQLSYTMCLPSLERPTATYQADWSGAVKPKVAPMLWRPAPPLPGPGTEWHLAP